MNLLQAYLQFKIGKHNPIIPDIKQTLINHIKEKSVSEWGMECVNKLNVGLKKRPMNTMIYWIIPLFKKDYC